MRADGWKVLQVEVSSSETGTGWFLHQVDVTSPEGTTIHFPCNSWIGKSDADGLQCEGPLLSTQIPVTVGVSCQIMYRTAKNTVCHSNLDDCLDVCSKVSYV